MYIVRYAHGRGRKITATFETEKEALDLAEKLEFEGCTVDVSVGGDAPNENRIRTLRTRAGLTLKQVAERAGMPYQAIQRLESGARDIGKMSLASATAIAKALGVHAEDLLNKGEELNTIKLDKII